MTKFCKDCIWYHNTFGIGSDLGRCKNPNVAEKLGEGPLNLVTGESAPATIYYPFASVARIDKCGYNAKYYEEQKKKSWWW